MKSTRGDFKVQNSFISVVTATRNREGFLMGLLESLCNQSFHDFEVIIVDDSDRSRRKERMADIDKTCSDKLKIKILRNPRNIGLPLSLNRGVSKANGDIIVFTDDDCIADKDWLSHIVKRYKSPKIGGVGGRVVPIERDALWLPTKTKRTHLVGRLSWDGNVISNFELGQKPVFVDFLSGANMSFRRELIKKVGGFSPIYKGNAYRFETGLSLKVKKLGFKIIFDPNAIVFHRRANKGGCRVNVYDWNYWFSRNHTLFVLRCLKGKVVKVFLFTLEQLLRILRHQRACPYAKPKKWHLVLQMFIKGLLDGLRTGELTSNR